MGSGPGGTFVTSRDDGSPGPLPPTFVPVNTQRIVIEESCSRDQRRPSWWWSDGLLARLLTTRARKAPLMEIRSACEIINESAVFAPGWTLTASDFSHRFENTIRMNVNYPACQTARDDAREGYPELIHTDASFLVVCDSHNLESLARQMLVDMIFPIQEHEAREMLRFKPTFWAPFHPHKVEGMQRWGTPDRDLRFGIS